MLFRSRQTGEDYLHRYYLFIKDRKWFPFNLTLHKIVKSDDPIFHDHPWPYMTVVLKGGYWEHTPVFDKDGKVIIWQTFLKSCIEMPKLIYSFIKICAKIKKEKPMRKRSSYNEFLSSEFKKTDEYKGMNSKEALYTIKSMKGEKIEKPKKVKKDEFGFGGGLDDDDIEETVKESDFKPVSDIVDRKSTRLNSSHRT